MSLDRWIALGACVASFISAIAALLVVRQSNLQRKLSYKPQVILKNNFFEYEFNDILSIAESIKFEKASNTNSSRSDIAINIGLGAALNIKITWIHDYNKLAIILNKYLEKLNKKNTIKIDSGGISFLDADKNPYTFIVNKNQSEQFDYILPYNQKPSPTEIFIPSSFISLTCIAMYYSWHVEKVMNESLPELIVRIEYKDIGGESHIDEYNVRIEFHHALTNNESITFAAELCFDKKRNLSGTTRTLEGIRKSYADFITEYNTNKNN